MLRSALCVVLAVCVGAPLIACVYLAAPAPAPEAAARFAYAAFCRPEPGERLAFLTGLLVLPAGIGALTFAWRRRGDDLALAPAARWTAELVLGTLLVGICWLSLRGAPSADRFYHLRLNVFWEQPGWSLPLLLGMALLLWGRAGSTRAGQAILHALVLTALAFVALGHLVSAKGAYAGHYHFSAVFFPVVAVSQGWTVLLDTASQYGLYPHFLNPLWQLTGLSVARFTALMGLLTALGYGALWLALWGGLRHRVVAALGLFALIFNGWFHFIAKGTGQHPGPLDPYFQYYPIRFVFPACMIALAWPYFRRPTSGRYWATLLLAGVAPLWNFDSGMPALLAWLAALCYGELFAGGPAERLRRCAAHAIRAAATLVLVGAVYAFAIYLGHGSFPDYRQHFFYQRLCYGEGFGMLPIPSPGAWALALLVYFAGLAYAARALALGESGPTARMALLLSVLGLGLFAYYQGRSHREVLTLAWWPCFLLLAIFLDELIARGRTGAVRPLSWLAGGLIAWLLAGSTCSLPIRAAFLTRSIRTNLASALDATPAVADETALLRQLTRPGDPVVVVSHRDGLIHLASGVPSCCPCGISQALLVDDFRKLQDRIEKQGVKVLADREAFADPQTILARTAWPLLDALQRGFTVLGETERTYVLAKRPLLLSAGGSPLLHLGFQAPTAARGKTFTTVSLPRETTLEVVLRPAADQVERATILSQRAGPTGLRGFAIERAGGTATRYRVLLGDGQHWQRLAAFDLTPNRWNYLALVLSANGPRLSVNGARVAAANAGPVPPPDRPRPLCVGNWAGGDRPFQGFIKEVRLLPAALPEADLARNQDLVRRQLGD